MKRQYEENTTDSKRMRGDLKHSQSHGTSNTHQHQQYTNQTRSNIKTDQKIPDRYPRTAQRSNFKPLPVNQTFYDENFPYFRKPNEIGWFSQDHDRHFKDDSSQLKIYQPPSEKKELSFDLRQGYKIFNKRDETVKELLNDLLHWIMLHRNNFVVHGLPAGTDELPLSLSTDFVCWRGLLTTLLCTPYENREGWLIAVTRFNNTYYMCAYDTEEKLLQRENDTERQKEMTYWGHKFEQYVTAENRDAQPQTDKPVNNKEAYVSVVRTRLTKHSIVYGGEIDCYEKNDGKRTYIELKTSREIEHPRQLNNFKRFKLIKWWAQSFLIGIEKIVCGFRDDDGVVRRLEDFNTMNLPKYCQDINNCWQPNVCFNFLDNFLQHVKDTVTTDDPKIVHLFRWQPRQPVTCERCPANSEYCFLPTWYTEQIAAGAANKDG